MAARAGTRVAVAARVLRSLVATATASAFLATGCAGQRPWPAHPVAVASGAFTSHGDVATIDVLPLDLQLWSAPDYDPDLDEIRARAEASIMNVAVAALTERNYNVGAMIDWNGLYAGGTALQRPELLATVGALAHYGATASAHPGQLPVPFLPARLGATTGADATLYIGGWGYVAKPSEGAGAKVFQGLVVALLVLTVVAVVALALSDSKSKSKSKSDSKSDSIVRDHRGGSFGGHGGFSASRGVEHVHRDGGWRLAAGLADAFGRIAIDAAVQADWGEDETLPHDGDDPLLYLEMTLVDNRTGLALWHARQQFPGSAASPEDTARAAATELALLPRHVASAPPAPEPPAPPVDVPTPAPPVDGPAAAAAAP